MNAANRYGSTKRLIVCIIGLLLVGGLAIRWRYSSLEVDVHRLERAVVADEVFGTGTLEAKKRAALGAQIASRIARVAVDAGDFVKKGQTLLYLEDSELRRQVEATEAAREAAQAAVDRVKAELLKARAIARSARNTHKRDVSLQASKIVADADMDKSEEMLAVAEAEVKRLTSAVAEAEAQYRSVGRTLAYHNARRAYAEVEAPFDGLVVTRLRDPGDVVVPGSTILEIVALDVLWVRAWVDEVALKALHPKQPARVFFRSNPEEVFPGVVERLGRQVDRETREFIVDVRVKLLPANWAIGQRAEVFIETNRKESVLAVPQDCLDRRGSTTGVWLVEQGSVRWKPVSLGLVGRKTSEVVSGLERGAVIVKLNRNLRSLLADGRVVVVR